MLTNPADIGLRYPRFGVQTDPHTDQIEWEAAQGEPVRQEKAADFTPAGCPSKYSGLDVWFNLTKGAKA